jgi:hypothetical protein
VKHYVITQDTWERIRTLVPISEFNALKSLLIPVNEVTNYAYEKADHLEWYRAMTKYQDLVKQLYGENKVTHVSLTAALVFDGEEAPMITRFVGGTLADNTFVPTDSDLTAEWWDLPADTVVDHYMTMKALSAAEDLPIIPVMLSIISKNEKTLILRIDDLGPEPRMFAT